MQRKLTTMIAAAALVAVLSACGTGGGQSPAPTPEPTKTEMMGTPAEGMKANDSMPTSDSMQKESMDSAGESMQKDGSGMAGGEMKSEGSMESQNGMQKDGSMTSDPVMEKDSMAPADGMTKDGMSEPSVMMKPEGRYLAYSPEALASATQAGRAVLFFKADWCPTCRAADADFNANLASIPQDVTVLQVNYDTEADLKREYRITYQHTFVQVDGSGGEVTRWSGGGVDGLLSNVR